MSLTEHVYQLHKQEQQIKTIGFSFKSVCVEMFALCVYQGM